MPCAPVLVAGPLTVRVKDTPATLTLSPADLQGALVADDAGRRYLVLFTHQERELVEITRLFARCNLPIDTPPGPSPLPAKP